MSYYNKIESIRRTLYVSKFLNEQNYLQNNNIDNGDNTYTTRLKNLNKIILKKHEEDKDVNKNNIKLMFNNIDKYNYIFFYC